MPRLNVDTLIKLLRQHTARLHEIYVDCNNLVICDRLMMQIVTMEGMIVQLQTLLIT